MFWAFNFIMDFFYALFVTKFKCFFFLEFFMLFFLFLFKVMKMVSERAWPTLIRWDSKPNPLKNVHKSFNHYTNQVLLSYYDYYYTYECDYQY